MDHETLTKQAELNAATIKEEYSLVGVLRPSITKDDNQWCVLYGDNLQDGIAGFGDTPHKAVISFNIAWHTKTGAYATLPGMGRGERG